MSRKEKITDAIFVVYSLVMIFYLPFSLSEKLRVILIDLTANLRAAQIVSGILWAALGILNYWLVFEEGSPIQADQMRQGLLLNRKDAKEVVKRLWPVLGPDGRRWAADELTRDIKEDIEKTIFEKGRAQGRKEGLAQGRKEGLAQGREEGYSLGHSEGYKYALYTQNRFRYYNDDPPLTYEEARRSLDEGTDGANGELIEPPKKPRTRKKKAEPELIE